jgi:quercetin dioxygenase-like cupin family protein
LFGGIGEVSVVSLLAPQGPFTAVLLCELSAGGSVGRHVQEEFPEIVVGLAGEGRATIDGREHALGPGSTVYLPLGSVLAIENRSAEEPLTYLIVKARDEARGAP